VLRAYAPDPEPYRADACPDWLDEIDLSLSGAHVRMGTHSLREDRWLTPDHHATVEVALRRRLLAEQRPLVFACTTFAEESAHQAAGMIDDWLASHSGVELPEPVETHHLARVGANVQEDLCLMVQHHGAWHLEGAVLCFPSLWVLSEKLGRPSELIHAPVPYYAEELNQRVNTFFDRLSPGKPVWRRNFSIWPNLLLWAPCHELDPSLHPHIRLPDGDPSGWLRSERQTLRRLPDSAAILFTIRVQSAPLTVLRQRPDRARDLAAWLRSPLGQVRRNQMGPMAEDLMSWLDAVGSARPRSDPEPVADNGQHLLG